MTSKPLIGRKAAVLGIAAAIAAAIPARAETHDVAAAIILLNQNMGQLDRAKPSEEAQQACDDELQRLWNEKMHDYSEGFGADVETSNKRMNEADARWDPLIEAKSKECDRGYELRAKQIDLFDRLVRVCAAYKTLGITSRTPATAADVSATQICASICISVDPGTPSNKRAELKPPYSALPPCKD